MPEAAIDKNRELLALKSDVRTPTGRLHVDAVTGEPCLS